MDARPHLIAIIVILFILFSLPGCQRQSVSTGLPSAPPSGPSGGGGSAPINTPSSGIIPATMTPVAISSGPVAPPSASQVPTAPAGNSPSSAPPTAPATVPTPVLAPVQPTADIPCNVRGTHVVAQGDNLYRIALRYRMSMEGLARMNNLWDPNYLRVGQRLQTLSCYNVRSYGWWVWERGSYSPPPPSGYGPVVSSSTYVVQPGDTLYRIAVRFNTTVRDLMTANGLPNENVAAGQQLFVP